MLETLIKVKEVAHHRNGITAQEFHLVRFSFAEGENMVAVVFDREGQVAVLDADKTAAGNIAFGHGNSWRGDNFERLLRVAIKDYENVRLN